MNQNNVIFGLAGSRIMQNEELKGLFMRAHNALMEWQMAQNFFHNVSDPDLVDCAIYNLETSRRKYEYYLRKLKDADSIYDQDIPDDDPDFEYDYDYDYDYDYEDI